MKLEKFSINLIDDIAGLSPVLTESMRKDVFPIHMQLGNYPFPSVNWDDFGIDLLQLWASATLQLFCNPLENKEFEFLDGAFSAICSFDSNCDIEISFIERLTFIKGKWPLSVPGREFYRGLTTYENLVTEVLNACLKVKEWREKFWNLKEDKVLGQEITLLHKLLSGDTLDLCSYITRYNLEEAN